MTDQVKQTLTRQSNIRGFPFQSIKLKLTFKMKAPCMQIHQFVLQSSSKIKEEEDIEHLNNDHQEHTCLITLRGSYCTITARVYPQKHARNPCLTHERGLA